MAKKKYYRVSVVVRVEDEEEARSVAGLLSMKAGAVYGSERVEGEEPEAWIEAEAAEDNERE